MDGKPYTKFDKMSIIMDCAPLADTSCYFSRKLEDTRLTGETLKRLDLHSYAVGAGLMNVQYIYDVALCREECLREEMCSGINVCLLHMIIMVHRKS